jgi:hypothetical protein
VSGFLGGHAIFSLAGIVSCNAVECGVNDMYEV